MFKTILSVFVLVAAAAPAAWGQQWVEGVGAGNTSNRYCLHDASNRRTAWCASAAGVLELPPGFRLQANLAAVYNPQLYNFSPIIPGVNLTGGVPAILTLDRLGGCPYGVSGAATGHYLYISGGSGTAEAVLITGGTCTSGATSGTLAFTPANNHSGAWKIESATAGIQEAINAAEANTGTGEPGLRPGATVFFPAGVYLARATISLKPFINYVGVRGTTADTDPSFTIYTAQRGSVIRAHTSIFTENNATQGVLAYVVAGDMTMRDLTFVGTAAINSNPNSCIQFGTSGVSRPFEGTAQNVQGLTIDHVNTVACKTGWEIFNIGDTTAYNARWESNTTSLLFTNNPAMPAANEIDLVTPAIFTGFVGIGFSSDSRASHIIRVLGGNFVNVQPSVATNHVSYGATIAPRVDLSFHGTEFRTSAAVYYQWLISGNFDTVARTIQAGGAVRSGNVVTINTGATPHGLWLGERVTIAGVTDASFNGTFVITGVNNLVSPYIGTTFTYAQTAADATSGGGTATPADNPVSVRCYGCRFLGGQSQINRGGGAATAQNFAFYDSKFVNTNVTISNANAGRFDGSTFSNSYVNLTSATSMSFANTSWRDYSGTAIQFADAGSNNGNLLGARFENVTTPYTAAFNGATGWNQVTAGPMLLGTVTFAALGTPTNGSIVYCSDCTIASPCAGGGTGAIAKRLNAFWVCN